MTTLWKLYKGFGLHPHQNMEIISVMLAGSMNHKDTLGYSEVVHKDWVQIMSVLTAASANEEYNVGEDEVTFTNLIELQIAKHQSTVSAPWYFPEEKERTSCR